MSDSTHRRSVGFLDLEGRRWSCFLITARTGISVWRGHFAFRPCSVDGDAPTPPAGGAPEGTPGNAPAPPVEGWLLPLEGEVCTAEIFVEESEGEIERKARSMGRPLLTGLLSSALHVRKRAPGALGEPIRDLLAERRAGEDDPRLASRYASYRLDQLAHLISLMEPAHFDELVNRILADARVDFSTRDRTQLALLVVERLEAILPLPPFEVWVLDYLADPGVYHLYAHRLHRLGVLDD